jgi:hypothetical protein
MFYIFNQDLNKNVKFRPQNIIEFLDPVVLAYLIQIQTDGICDKGRKIVKIYTNSYQKEEVKNLEIAINNKGGLYTGVLHDRKNQWNLTIGAKKLNLLRETVSTHFYSSMLYRIGL